MVSNACAMALEAGADLVLMKAETSLVDETFKKIREFISSGRISHEELDRKVYRVLNLKHDYGLFTEFAREDPRDVINDPGIIALSKNIARRSVMLCQGRDLPLDKRGKILLVEQINKTPNDYFWHPAMFYRKCLSYNRNIDYLETSYTFDQSDKDRIMGNIEKYDTVIITNFYIRGKLANNEFIEGLLAKYSRKGKKIIVVANTPYPLSVPKNCDNLIVSYATSPDNLEVCAGVLFGAITAEGTYPIAWRDPARQ